jgi:hypothetical protein
MPRRWAMSLSRPIASRTMPRLGVPTTIDYSALIYPVSKAEVRTFRTQTRASGKAWGQTAAAQVVIVVFAILVFGILVLGFLGTSVLGALGAVRNGGGFDAIAALGFPVPFVALVVVIVIVILRAVLQGTSWTTWMRLTRFAEANGMVFSPEDPAPGYPGQIFTIGHSQQALNHLRSTSNRYLDMGNFRYVTGSGKNATTHNWGFLAFKLDRRLPNIVLDSKANNGLFGSSNLPAAFAKDQILHLEGDFDTFFTLYCPKEYERDALYIFTPDLMALLIDEAAPFDVEIIDDWMFVYSAKPFISEDPAVYQRLFRIVDTVGAKALSQTDRYTDERIGSFEANYVAPAGQRLRRGVSVGAVVTVVAFAIFWGIPWILGLVGN